MPIERCEWTTDVPEVGHQLLNDVFAADRAMKFSGSSTDFRFQLRTSLAGVVYADRPITVAEIAEAAGIGVRSLQSAFLRHRGLTPMGYARRARLERAHYELLAADPAGDTTVKMIAARWGFAKPDRFSALYREAFGVLPSRTLRM
jgi:AraC-like DNA-binding protein